MPLEIARRCVRAVCPPDGILLDPFLGSGTTALAAIAESRAWVGIELDPVIAQAAEERIARDFRLCFWRAESLV